METELAHRVKARWWIDSEMMALVEPLIERLTAPLAHLALDAQWSRSLVIRQALAALAQRAIPETDVTAIQRYMVRWPTRDLAFRTWAADDEELGTQQQLAADLGLRTADVQALAVRYLAESYGLAVPDWRTPPAEEEVTDGPPQQA